MATPPTSIAGRVQAAATAPSTTKQFIGGLSFDSFFIFAILWFEGGTFVDAWAHNHIPRLETFFTPWHAVLYSGLLVVASAIFGPILLNRRRGATWQQAIPQGYGLTVLGVCLMFVGGLGDMIWHTLFGVEQNIDAIFSPTHLTMMVAIGLIAAGPLRAAYQRSNAPSSPWEHWMITISILPILLIIANVSQGASIFVTFWPTTAAVGENTAQLLAVVSFILQAIIFTGLTLYTLRRWPLPLGFATCILTLVAIPLSLMRDHYVLIPISFVAGILIDAAYHFLKPSMQRPVEFRIFAVIAASALYAVYMATLELTMTVIWTVHMTIGSVVVVGIAGWLLSYLVLPGQQPVSQE